MKYSKKGFTLAEVLIVVAIIGVLVSISIPVFSNRLSHTREVVCLANRRSLKAHILSGYINGEYNNAAEGFQALYTDHLDDTEYVCPSGGTFSLAQSDDPIAVQLICSYHDGSGSDTPPGGGGGGGSGVDPNLPSEPETEPPARPSDQNVLVKDKNNQTHLITAVTSWKEYTESFPQGGKNVVADLVYDETGVWLIYRYFVTLDPQAGDKTLAEYAASHSGYGFFQQITTSTYLYTEADYVQNPNNAYSMMWDPEVSFGSICLWNGSYYIYMIDTTTAWAPLPPTNGVWYPIQNIE